MKENKSTRIFQSRPWDQLNEFIAFGNYSSLHIVVDDHTNQSCLPVFLESISQQPEGVALLPSGELNKDLNTCEKLWSQWMHDKLDRNSLVIALGGGVLCDLVGFCAATFQRGLDCVYVPTSLMAMVDAAFGGKTAVNLHMTKNMIGLFNLPQAILLDPIFLKTLDDRQMKNGFAEIIKHSLIQDPPYWQDIENGSWPVEEEEMNHLIKRSIRTKLDIVEKDPLENNIRKALNFGHTIGHAIEKSSLESARDVLHGEAIAIGMIVESIISAQKYHWKPTYLERITNLLLPFVNKQSWDECLIPKILEDVQFDKKRIGKNILFSLLEQPGKPVWNVNLNSEEIQHGLNTFHELNIAVKT
ncbi:MAG: 3-dehydroquinate synthase [Saprospiraceae bacterium]|nr:3-dehydroquinate synthase [Saprospiraceae bacterium]